MTSKMNMLGASGNRVDAIHVATPAPVKAKTGVLIYAIEFAGAFIAIAIVASLILGAQ